MPLSKGEFVLYGTILISGLLFLAHLAGHGWTLPWMWGRDRKDRDTDD